MVRLLHHPQIGFPGPLDRVGIGNIKDIPQAKPGPGIIQQSNAFCAAVDPAVHLEIPQFQFRAGRRIGALGVNQKIVLERIAV